MFPSEVFVACTAKGLQQALNACISYTAKRLNQHFILISLKVFVKEMSSPSLWVYNTFIDEVLRQYTGFTVAVKWLFEGK
jgi:hypothetical protein